MAKKIISLDELAYFKSLLADVAISGEYGDLEGKPLWIGTQEEYESEVSDIPVGTVIVITDDGGTVIEINYADITNKPQINGITLESNKTSAQLGLVGAEAGKGLSTNDFTSAEKSKLAGIAAGAQENLIENITVNGVAQAINNKTVALTVMTNTVNNLVNYYTKSETYTQAEVDNLISAIPKFAIKVVDALPTTDISNSTVYLLRTSETETGNLYTEYIYAEVTTGTYQWEKLGTQTLDLSNYVTTDELNAILTGYVTNTALATELAKYTDNTTLTSLLNNKVDKVTGKGLSTNDYTDDDKNKLNGIAAGAQVNVIESISVNGTAQTPANKVVDITVPEVLNDLDDAWVGTVAEYEVEQGDIPANTVIIITDDDGNGNPLNYVVLANKPQINGITLTGNKTANDLGLATKTYVDQQIAQAITQVLATSF